jgi:hypothetical protein
MRITPRAGRGASSLIAFIERSFVSHWPVISSFQSASYRMIEDSLLFASYLYPVLVSVSFCLQ